MGATMTTIHALTILLFCRAQFTLAHVGGWHFKRDGVRAWGPTRYRCALSYARVQRDRRRRRRLR